MLTIYELYYVDKFAAQDGFCGNPTGSLVGARRRSTQLALTKFAGSRQRWMVVEESLMFCQQKEKVCLNLLVVL